MIREDNFHEIFDTDFEAERLILRLKYGYNARADYDEILEYLQCEILEVQQAFWSALDRYRVDVGHRYEVDPEYEPYKNDLMVENFAEKFGWDREALMDRIAG
jgi:hypothetical protein